jgi:hypothetical protein
MRVDDRKEHYEACRRASVRQHIQDGTKPRAWTGQGRALAEEKGSYGTTLILTPTGMGLNTVDTSATYDTSVDIESF